MKCFAKVVCCLSLLVNVSYGQDKTDAPKAQASPLKTVKQKVSYGFGLNIGRNMTRQKLDIDVELLAQGIRDALSKKQPLLNEEELEAAMVQFQKDLRQKQAEERIAGDAKLKAEADKNKKDGDAYLAVNKKKKGVTTLKSGLQYTVLKSGNGKSPKLTDEVTTHYHGMLIDGKVFDSSVDRGTPASFPVNGVIKGWTEALQLMKVGDKWRLVVPSELAYGVSPRPGGPIGPNAVLVFEVELLAIK